MNREAVFIGEGCEFYRCALCGKGLWGPWDLKDGKLACEHCGNKRIVPTELSLLEKASNFIRAWRWSRKHG